MFMATVPATMVINRVSSFWSGQGYGKLQILVLNRIRVFKSGSYNSTLRNFFGSIPRARGFLTTLDIYAGLWQGPRTAANDERRL